MRSHPYVRPPPRTFRPPVLRAGPRPPSVRLRLRESARACPDVETAEAGVPGAHACAMGWQTRSRGARISRDSPRLRVRGEGDADPPSLLAVLATTRNIICL